MYATDRRETASSLNAPAYGAGHNKIEDRKTGIYQTANLKIQRKSALSLARRYSFDYTRVPVRATALALLPPQGRCVSLRSFVCLLAGLRKTTQPMFTKFDGKVAHGQPIRFWW